MEMQFLKYLSVFIINYENFGAFYIQATEPMLLDTETILLDTETISLDTETLSLDTETISLDTETLSLDTERGHNVPYFRNLKKHTFSNSC